MEAFSQEVIGNIKNANNEEELIWIISNSMSQLRKKGTFNEPRYIMHMIISLRAMTTNGLSVNSINNIRLAMAMFRQLQKDSREPIF